jgi:hypothetical protein
MPIPDRMAEGFASDFVAALADRFTAEPDLDDFLLWWGGTLEYTFHIIASSIGRRAGWASRSEVPYITACLAPSAKTNVKWADAAVRGPHGCGILLEAKTVPMKETLGAAIEQEPKDLAALAAADWAATLSHARGSDTYTDPQWWTERERLTDPWAVQVALVHGRRPLSGIDERVRAGLDRGLRSLRYRFRNQETTWVDRVAEALDKPFMRREISGQDAEGVLFAWLTTIPT